jgi:hypothetical protein
MRATQRADDLRDGRLGAVERVREALRRLDALRPINAVTAVHRARALARAHALDHDRARGLDPGPLVAPAWHEVRILRALATLEARGFEAARPDEATT